jgi:hypothetical protein
MLPPPPSAPSSEAAASASSSSPPTTAAMLPHDSRCSSCGKPGIAAAHAVALVLHVRSAPPPPRCVHGGACEELVRKMVMLPVCPECVTLLASVWLWGAKPRKLSWRLSVMDPLDAALCRSQGVPPLLEDPVALNALWLMGSDVYRDVPTTARTAPCEASAESMALACDDCRDSWGAGWDELYAVVTGPIAGQDCGSAADCAGAAGMDAVRVAGCWDRRRGGGGECGVAISGIDTAARIMAVVSRGGGGAGGASNDVDPEGYAARTSGDGGAVEPPVPARLILGDPSITLGGAAAI